MGVNDSVGMPGHERQMERILMLASLIFYPPLLDLRASFTARLTFSYLLGGDLGEESGLGQHLQTFPPVEQVS